MRPWIGVPALLAVLVLSTDARAGALQEQIERVVNRETVHLAAEAARRGLVRFRRATTLGGTVHVAPALTLDGDRDLDLQVGGGLALLRYGIPTIPTYEEVRSIVLASVTSAVVAQIDAAAARGEVLSEDEQRRLVEETWQRFKDRLLLGLEPRHLEKPQFMLVGEASYLTSADAWDIRAMVGIGISRVFVAAGAALQLDGSAGLVIPVELSVPVLLTDGLRSPVAQIFVRGDFAVVGGDDPHTRGLVGVRLALDVL
jgi:hypothetical protein